jgi:hypothetical protein
MRSVGKVAVGVFGAIAASKAISAIRNVAAEAMEAGMEVLDVHERLRLSGEKAAKHMERTSKAKAPIESQTESIIKQSEALEQWGHDAEAMQTMVARIQESGSAERPAVLSFTQITKDMPALEDMLTKVKGIKPGMEGAAEAGQMFVSAVRGGNLALAKGLDIPLTQQKAFRAIEKEKISADAKEQKRLEMVMGWLKGIEGATKKAFATPRGAMAHAEIAKGNVFETLGKQDPAKVMALANSYREMWVALGELAERADVPWFTEKFFVSIKDTADQATAAIKFVFSADTYNLAWQGFQASLKGMWDESALNTQVQWNKSMSTLSEQWNTSMADMARQWNDTWNAFPQPVRDAITAISSFFHEQFGAMFAWLKSQFNEIPASVALPPGTPSMAPQEGDYVPPWQDPEESKRIKKAEDTWTPGPGIPARPKEPGSASLQQERARLVAELDNPRVRALLKARTEGEVGGQGAEAQQAFMETVFNRAAARNQTLAQTLVGSYWGSRLKKYGAARGAAYDEQIAAIQKGSDLARLATGNESAGLRGGPVLKSVAGERFIAEQNKKDLAWIKRQRAAAAGQPTASLSDTVRALRPVNGGTTNQSVTMAPVITVNGVQGGKELALANKIKMAMRDPLNEGLRQLKAMRAQEQRLGYV